MPVEREENGKWKITSDESGKTGYEESHQSYIEALPRYLTVFEKLFFEAREKSDFEFINCLLRVRGVAFGNWDPYETTLEAIPRINKAHEKIKEDFYGARHLQLWVYGHVVEASEPYELIMNLIRVRNGLQFHALNFPDHKSGRPQSPGEKISVIEKSANDSGLIEIGPVLREMWNRELRNSIFHSDYVLLGSSVRLPKIGIDYSHDQILT
jgi:hypothetical protein